MSPTGYTCVFGGSRAPLRIRFASERRIHRSIQILASLIHPCVRNSCASQWVHNAQEAQLIRSAHFRHELP